VQLEAPAEADLNFNPGLAVAVAEVAAGALQVVPEDQMVAAETVVQVAALQAKQLH